MKDFSNFNFSNFFKFFKYNAKKQVFVSIHAPAIKPCKKKKILKERIYEVMCSESFMRCTSFVAKILHIINLFSRF